MTSFMETAKRLRPTLIAASHMDAELIKTVSDSLMNSLAFFERFGESDKNHR
jgi:hypothetical protein